MFARTSMDVTQPTQLIYTTLSDSLHENLEKVQNMLRVIDAKSTAVVVTFLLSDSFCSIHLAPPTQMCEPAFSCFGHN